MIHALLAGSAKVDITPPLTIPYLGYEPRHAFFEGVHDSLYARAVALEGEEALVIIIAADAIGFSNEILGEGRNFTEEVRQRIVQRIGAPAHILLATSHAHSTPETVHLRRLLDTPATAPWLEVLIDQLASAASMAFAQRRPSELKVGVGQVKGLSRNRRVIGADGRIVSGPERTVAVAQTKPQPLDTEVGVLYIAALDQSSCTVLANFACHPVTVQVQPLVSADFPGPAMTFVERNLPNCHNSLFLQGACGNINPIRNTTDFADVARYGLMLGGEVVKVAAGLSAGDCQASPPLLAVRSTTLLLEARTVPPYETARQLYDEAVSSLEGVHTEEERQIWRRKQRLAEETLILLERGSEPIPAEVQVIRLGDLAVVALPGEPFVELGLAIKARSPAPYTFVVGYSNDWIGYLTTPEAWQQGGYEVSTGPWTRVGPQGGVQLVEKSLELLRLLWA